MKGVKWCLFDVDDTLVSSNIYLGLYTPIVTRLVSEKGIPFTKLNAEIERLRGLKEGGRPDTYDLCDTFHSLDIYYQELAKHISATPTRREVKRLFEALKEMGKGIGIVSNSHNRTVKMILEHHDVLDSVDWIFCFEDGGKKDTLNFWQVLLQKKELEPKETIAIDNNRSTLDNAEVLGFKVLHVETLIDFNTLKYIS